MRKVLSLCVIATLGFFANVGSAAPPAAAPQTIGPISEAQCLQACFDQMIANNNACKKSCVRCTVRIFIWCVASEVNEACFGTCTATAKNVYTACANGCNSLPTP